MKKIGVYLESGPACGGAYQYNRTLLEALDDYAKLGNQVIIFYLEPHWQKTLKDKKFHSYEQVNYSVWWRKVWGVWRRLSLPLQWWRAFAKYCHPLAKKMLKKQCDIWIFPTQDALAYWMPVPALATIHDLMHRYESQFEEVGCKKEYGWREFHYYHTCLYAKGILVDSALGKQHVEESYPQAKPHCHVLPYVAPKNIETTFYPEFDQEYALPEKFIFYPAQFWRHKNHVNLLHAIYQCRQQGYDVHCVFVGSKKNGYDEVERLIRELKLQDNVHILGLVADQAIPEFYRRARALVMPTFFGPTNIPPLEAFALGCPVAISKIYAIPEQLKEAALYFDPHNVRDIADKIMKLWNHDTLWLQLKEQAKHHSKHNSYQNFSEEFISILDKIESR